MIIGPPCERIVQISQRGHDPRLRTLPSPTVEFWLGLPYETWISSHGTELKFNEWGKKTWGEGSVWSTGEGGGEEGETAAGGLLQSWGEAGDGIWGDERRGEDLQSASLLPWLAWPAGSRVCSSSQKPARIGTILCIIFFVSISFVSVLMIISCCLLHLVLIFPNFWVVLGHLFVLFLFFLI